MDRTSRVSLSPTRLSRREFGITAGLAVAGLAFRSTPPRAQGFPVAVVRSKDRVAGLQAVVEVLGGIDVAGRDIYLKASYGSAEPFPATTHLETLETVVAILRKAHCGMITLVERSGMGNTSEIWKLLGVTDLARKLDLNLLAMEGLPSEEWRKFDIPTGGWKSGIEVPRFLDESACVVQITNIKAHRFGGVFSASLKNSLGFVAKYGSVNGGYNYMKELHGAAQQGAMIAEVNLAYRPRLVIMDAAQVFITDGPEAGELAAPGAFLASPDRVAIDAVGVALLKLQRGVPDQPIYDRTVFEHEQLKRAAELGLGARNGKEIQFITGDSISEMLGNQLEGTVQETPPKR